MHIIRTSRENIGEDIMIKFKDCKNIYLYSENVDMRMGLKKIQLLVATNFNNYEITHSVFVFCSGNGKSIKIYYEDDYGCWLLQNRLKDGKFKWPKGLDIGTKISASQLEGLCKGLEVVESKKHIDERPAEYF